MPLPTLVAQAATAALNAFCEKRVPPQFRDQIQLVHSARGNTITLTEVRPHWVSRENSRAPTSRSSGSARRRARGTCTGRIGATGGTSTTLRRPAPTSAR